MIKSCCHHFLSRSSLSRYVVYGSEQIFISKPKHGNCRLYCVVEKHGTTEKEVLDHADNSSESEQVKDESCEDKSIIPHRRRFVSPPTSLLEAVHRSQFLRDLVDMGVNLNKIALKSPLDFDFITSIRSWENGPRERLKFLLQIGVPQESLASIITDNPKILDVHLDDMDVRVNYLLSKKFTHENIASMVCGCPKLLSMSTRDVDARLGYFQAAFRLSGDQVRNLVLGSPWLISWPADKLSDTVKTLTLRLGFTIKEVQHILPNNTKIWSLSTSELEHTVRFLNSEVGLSHYQMTKNHQLLSKRLPKMKTRYKFMLFMKRVNFDPSKEHYTPYDILWEGTLEEFCDRLHTTVDAYDTYVKSL